MVSPRYLAWLRYENHSGANVYVAANPLRPGSRKRTKECIAEVRHLYIDIDVDGENRIAALEAVGCCSRSKRHSLDIAGQVSGAMEGRRLRLRPAGDHAQVARHHLRRRLCLHRPQPGSSRPGIPQLQVRTRSPSDRRISQRRSIYHPEDFRLDDSVIESSHPESRSRTSHIPAARTAIRSRIGMWVVQQLSLGEDAGKLTLALASAAV